MLDIDKIFTNGELFDGRYKLIDLLSSDGGTADVWLAIDWNTVDDSDNEESGTQVAIKIYRPKNLIDIGGEQQFRKEFKQVWGCHHSNLITPTDFSIYQGAPYLVVPYCPLGSSEQLIEQLIDEKDLWKYAGDVASGLAYLHKRAPQIIHQDIKPANVLLDDSGNYSITDFGISTFKGADSMDEDDSQGTFAYMAPERFNEGYIPIPESDIWALGATLYEIVTGRVPFGEDGGLAQRQGTKMRPLPSTVPSSIKDLIVKCLSLNPASRPTAQEIADKAVTKVGTKRFLGIFGGWVIEMLGHLSKKVIRLILIIAGALLAVGIAFVAVVFFFKPLPANKQPYDAAMEQIIDPAKYQAGYAMLDSLASTGDVRALRFQSLLLTTHKTGRGDNDTLQMARGLAEKYGLPAVDPVKAHRLRMKLVDIDKSFDSYAAAAEDFIKGLGAAPDATRAAEYIGLARQAASSEDDRRRLNDLENLYRAQFKQSCN